MDIPLCCGQPRSASTLTWQIVKCLAPQSRPLNWDPDCDVREYTGHPGDWPIKRHDYMAGSRSVIYTYRHPIEAFLSARRCFLVDNDYASATHHALRQTLEAQEIFAAYKEDQTNGRLVLFLRYEDYYDNPINRIHAIATFMGISPPLTSYEVTQITEHTSLQVNSQRAGKSFEKDRDAGGFGIQGAHINKSTHGRPGSELKAYATFVPIVKTDPTLKQLRDMCEEWGYEL